MKIAFLIRGSETKNQFVDIDLPEGVEKAVGTYKAEGGDLFFVSFSIDGNTIGNARVLASLRDNLPANNDVRVLNDEASAKFCELLYPHFCRFEKGLRTAITVATCAEQGNFDDKHVVELEEQLSLEALYAVLFVDAGFVKETRNLVKGNFTREDLLAKLDSIEEHLLWDVLFNKEDMPTFRDRRMDVKNRRNDVMHYHKMTEETFDETRELMKAINGEIDAYLNRVRSDVAYPKAKAENARVAAQKISETYADMLESIRASFDFAGMYDFSSQIPDIGRMLTDAIDMGSYSTVAQISASMGDAGLSSVAQQIIDQQSFGLSESVSKAIESMKASMPMVDIAQIGAMQSASESMRLMRASISATMEDTFRGIADCYQQVLPHETLDSLRLASFTSMDFSAGLGLGSALSRALDLGAYADGDEADDHDDESSEDNPVDSNDE